MATAPKSGPLVWVNAGLAVVLVTVVAGPAVVRWLSPAGAPATPPSPAPPEHRALRGVDAAVPVPLPALPAPPALPALVVEPAPPAAAGAPPDGGRRSLGAEAHALYREGRIAEACERYRESQREISGEEGRRQLAACLARLGRDAYQAGQFGPATEHYRRAVDEYPGLPLLWTALALSHAGAGDHARARSVLAEAERRFPGEPEILYLLAEVQERQGRSGEAAATLRRLLAVHPGHARGKALLAALEQEQKVEGDYWSQESRHFLVRYEGARGIDVGRAVVDELEAAYESIGRDLGTYPRDRLQAGIYRTEVLGDLYGVHAEHVRGLFDPRNRRLRLNLAHSVAYSNDLARLVRHEYAHAVIDLASGSRAPIWLHEGLAQVLEPRAAPRGLAFGGVPRELLTLRGIERLGRTPDPTAYTVGYQLMHLAVEHLVDRRGMAGIRDLLARLGRGEDASAALRGAFGFGPEEVEARLRTAAGKE